MSSIETAYNREEVKLEVDGKQVFPDIATIEEAEEMIARCINGNGWPKEYDHYVIFTRQVTIVEGSWKPAE